MKIGLSYSALKIDENILREYQEAGIECIEVCCSYKDQFEKIDFKEIKKKIYYYRCILLYSSIRH